MPTIKKESMLDTQIKKDVESLSLEQQLQLAAANISGSLETKLTTCAVTTVIARIVQLSDQDRSDLMECMKDLTTIETQQDAEDTLNAILEILHLDCKLYNKTEDLDSLVRDKSDEKYQSWLQWISNKIYTVRSEKGLTQIELAKKSGLPQSHISRLEQGKHSPSHKTLKKIADACGVDVSILTLH